MDSLILGLRVLVSLGAVLGLMWLLHRRLRRGSSPTKAKALTVVSRQTVGPKASVVLVDTDGRRFLLGVTEHGINVLHSTEVPEPVVLTEAPLTRRAALRGGHQEAGGPAFDRELRRQLGAGRSQVQPLAGSALDPATWRMALDALRGGRRQ
ncbi:flagellar biosynthetic protein FliO [Sinomonas terrae]|uniref:Flagellar protein n=1 Tax=Sinomonas terrae TaxID=2908838 RepID=A0ABS9TW11_9MICC|nr:flagellar biosynthetic protein FliO [Sinomonas terrae]MCH6468560.1 flagellar biosynthetic protein FliO [Sinomonas terrae]